MKSYLEQSWGVPIEPPVMSAAWHDMPQGRKQSMRKTYLLLSSHQGACTRSC